MTGYIYYVTETVKEDSFDLPKGTRIGYYMDRTGYAEELPDLCDRVWKTKRGCINAIKRDIESHKKEYEWESTYSILKVDMQGRSCTILEEEDFNSTDE